MPRKLFSEKNPLIEPVEPSFLLCKLIDTFLAEKYNRILRGVDKMEEISILAADNLEEEGIEILKAAGFTVETRGKLSVEELERMIPHYDVLLVRSATKVPSSVIEKGVRLKIIGRAGVGLDTIDVVAATTRGIIVMNAPEGNTLSAAEHTFGLILSMARNIPPAWKSMQEGQWDRNRFMGTELFGKTLGVIGLGRIGRRVAGFGKAFGMEVLGYDPYVKEGDSEDLDISLVTLDGLCKESDIITLHVPLTKETEGILTEREFGLMKEGVMLVNAARGGLIERKALLENLDSGKIRAAAFDVFEKEPPEDPELLGRSNIFATPHLGASTKEAQIHVAKDICSQVTDALLRKVIRNAVNLPKMDERTVEILKGYLWLSEKIGGFVSQLVDLLPEELWIEYAGEIIDSDIAPLRAYLLKGFLERFHSQITYVNAPLMLREKKIHLRETKNPSAGEFSTAVTVGVKGETEVSVTGTLVDGKPKIRKIDGFAVEATPEGYLLVCFNDDRPGAMGYIGTLLGSLDVNIASMTLGRKVKHGPAITVLNLDAGVNETTLHEIGKFPGMRLVRLVKL